MDCLVTKLKGIVDDSSLLSLGEMRVNLSGTSKALTVYANGGIEISVLGNGHITDSTFVENKGTSTTETGKLYFSEDVDMLSLKPKYNVTQLLSNANLSLNIDDLKYSKIIYLEALNQESEGSIENLPSTLRSLYVKGSGITGNIGKLNTSLQGLSIVNANIDGSIDDIATITGIRSLVLNNCSKIVGNVKSLNGFTNMTAFEITNTGISGDLAYIPAKVQWCNLNNNNFNWTSGIRASTSYEVLAVQNAHFADGELDKFLIDNAKCNATGISSRAQSWYKIIDAYGNRTSASDSAVQTLKTAGLTIKINGVAL